MGTNYYIKGYDKTTIINNKTYDFYDRCSPIWHIGKRSAAGHYCFDCDMTLKIGGKENLHYNDKFYEECPQCKKSIKETGYASSFNRAITEDDLYKRIKEEGFSVEDNCIVDEYGKEYTYMTFIELVENCPIVFDHMIGEYFS